MVCHHYAIQSPICIAMTHYDALRCDQVVTGLSPVGLVHLLLSWYCNIRHCIAVSLVSLVHLVHLDILVLAVFPSADLPYPTVLV